MDKKVVIMRGIPGSGKSTYVKEHYFYNVFTVSADYYFIQKDGSYEFNKNKLSEAHATCMREFVEAVYTGWKTIVVDNTNINSDDIIPYIAVANAFNYKIEIVEFLIDPELAHSRNVHGVPLSTCVSMNDRKCRSNFSFLTKYKNVLPTIYIECK